MPKPKAQKRKANKHKNGEKVPRIYITQRGRKYMILNKKRVYLKVKDGISNNELLKYVIKHLVIKRRRKAGKTGAVKKKDDIDKAIKEAKAYASYGAPVVIDEYKKRQELKSIEEKVKADYDKKANVKLITDGRRQPVSAADRTRMNLGDPLHDEAEARNKADAEVIRHQQEKEKERLDRMMAEDQLLEKAKEVIRVREQKINQIVFHDLYTRTRKKKFQSPGLEKIAKELGMRVPAGTDKTGLINLLLSNPKFREDEDVAEYIREATVKEFPQSPNKKPAAAGPSAPSTPIKPIASASSSSRKPDDIPDLQGFGLADGDKPLYGDQIETLMKPYGDKFKGVVASDQIKKLILPKVEPKSRGSFIVNLDKHTQPGSHWVAVYYDDRPQTQSPAIEYNDSFGRSIPAPIKKQLEQIARKLGGDRPLELKTNRVVEQSVTSNDCGWHAADFIVKRYQGKSFKEVTHFNDVAKGEESVRNLKNKYNHFGYI